MSAESVILDGRRFSEQLMTSTCVVRRLVGQVFNDETLEYTDDWDDIYTGVCKIRLPDAQLAEVDAQGQLLVEQDGILSIPVESAGSDDVAKGDVAEITGNPLDAALIGAKFTVKGPHAQTAATARRFKVERVA